jgi:hypothetical protein
MRRQRQNIGAATASGNRGDGRRKGDVPVPKPAFGRVYLDLNKLVAASFEEKEKVDDLTTEKFLVESQVRQPIFIDNPAPTKTNIDHVILAQQLAMLRENAYALKIDITRPPSSPTFHTSKPTEWRCTWCLVQQIYTPTIRRGPLGPRSVCQPCGIWFEKGGVLPNERYQACRDGGPL